MNHDAYTLTDREYAHLLASKLTGAAWNWVDADGLMHRRFELQDLGLDICACEFCLEATIRTGQVYVSQTEPKYVTRMP